MFVAQEKTDSLFAEVSEKIRSSARQSHDGLIQLSYRRLSADPRDIEAIHVLAAFNLRNQKPQKSLSILQKDPTILADNSVGHRLAGYAYLAQRQPEFACRHFDHAVRLDPCQPDCWTMLGRIHEESGERDWAIKYYQRAIVFDGTQHDSALALSRLYARSKNLKQAIHTLRVSLLRDTRSPRLCLALAKLLKRRAAILGRNRRHRLQQRLLDEAYRCYRTANSSEPTSTSYISQGILEQQLERFHEATHSFQRAVTLKPDCPIAVTHLADSNVEAGHLDLAVQQFETAIAIDPKPSATHFRYTRAKRFKAGRQTDSYITQLTKLMSNANCLKIDQVQLNFALAKVLDDIGRYDQAWIHYDRANRLKHEHSDSVATRNATRNVPTESESRSRRGPECLAQVPLQRDAENSMRFFTREFLEANQHVGNPSETPVFIIGMPRSGTTLTEQILSSHPAIAGAGELKLIDRTRREIINDSRDGENDTYPESVASLDQGHLRKLADDYLTHLDTIRIEETRVTDKMPTNFLHLGLIALLFPGAKVIHCRRNPMDVLVSCYCQNLRAPFCDLQQLVHYHRSYRRMMAHWNESLPIKIHTVDYESLVTDPEPNSRAMIEHCGLEWDDQCLQFHTNKRAVHTPSKWQVRQPMYSSSIEKWRRFEPQLRHISTQMEQD